MSEPNSGPAPAGAQPPAWRPLPGSVGWLIGVGCVFIVAVAIYHAWSDLWVSNGVQFRDFRSYVAAGHAVLNGQSLYEEGIAQLPTIGGTFKYTPFAALLFTGLAILPEVLLPALVIGVNLIALLAIVWTSWRMLGHARDYGRIMATVGVGALCLGMQPVTWNITWGQVNVALLAIVILDLARPDDAKWKGAGIGLAAAVKLVPGIFIVYLLLTKRLRAAAVSAGVFVVTAGIGFALLPKQSLVFWSGNVADAERITGSGSADAAENQSIRGVIAKIVDDPDLATVKWLPIAVAIGVLAMAVAVLAYRRGSEFLAVCVVGATGVLVTPLAWSHYWVWFVPVFVLGLHLAWTHRYRWAWPATVVGYLLLFSWPLAFNKGAPFPGLIFVKNGMLQTLEVGLGLLVVVAAAIYVLRKPKTDAVADALTLP